LLAALAHVPHDGILTDRVDIVEVTTIYDGEGRETGTYIIFWEWLDWPHYDFCVVDWRRWGSNQQMPSKNHADGCWRVLWCDGQLLRRVVATTYRRTHTQYDAEVEDRKRLCVQHRRKLTTGHLLGRNAAGKTWR
jgi:hypothetical protein